MDLNHYYACHQISLIKASQATSADACQAHRRQAAQYADRVNSLRHDLPAGSARAL